MNEYEECLQKQDVFTLYYILRAKLREHYKGDEVEVLHWMQTQIDVDRARLVDELADAKEVA